MTGHDIHPSPMASLGGLLAPGERLGWQFRSRDNSRTPFAIPEPEKPAIKEATVAARSWSQLGKRLRWTAILGVAATVALAIWGSTSTAEGSEGQAQIGLPARILGVGTFLLLIVLVIEHMTYRSRAKWTARRPLRIYRRTLKAWQRQRSQHESVEDARVAGLPQWWAAGPAPQVTRLDIVGGSQAGWRDLLTVAGASYLATHGPSTVVDFTGDELCRDLQALCEIVPHRVDWQTPPHDCDLLTGLNSRQLVDVLVESVHGDGDRELRKKRAVDTRVLNAVVEALGDEVNLARILDALRVLLRLPGPTPSLTAAERAHIADELFPTDYLARSTDSLQQLEALLHPLRGLAGAERSPAVLTVVGVATDGTSARSELLNDLIVAWATRRVATRPDLCRTLVLAGADHLAARHIERLAEICARQDVTLIILWRNLRDTALRMLGSGAVAFMRLRHAEEATRAADFIGRQHKFVLSGLTRTVGGSTSTTDGTGTSDSESTGTNRGSGRTGRMWQLIEAADTWNRSKGSSEGITRSTSTQTSTTTGTNWSDTYNNQRVYEYAVEPGVLQGLPERALLLVEHSPDGARLRALDCNPAIVTLPDVQMRPAEPSTEPIDAGPTASITDRPPARPFTAAIVGWSKALLRSDRQPDGRR
ncbi:hypothetical protein [Polymorphospora sp. NPDC050346]|uniref:hypothetical protein n=1 Tax=Polymorphospora sp. NPDC050346 TaxID=3155780 RepID=UPI0033D23F59